MQNVGRVASKAFSSNERLRLGAWLQIFENKIYPNIIMVIKKGRSSRRMLDAYQKTLFTIFGYNANVL